MVSRADCLRLKRLQCAQLYQTANYSSIAISRALNVSLPFVRKWRHADMSNPKSFQDKARSGRPRIISGAKISDFKRQIEKDGPGNIKRVTEVFDISRSTTQRTIRRLKGRKKSNKKKLILIDRDTKKRLLYAKKRINQNFKKWTMFDDKAFQIPPDPPHIHTCPQYRFPGSKKKVISYKTKKSKTKIMMFVGTNYYGKSKPVFNVKKKRRKNGRGYRYETFSLNTQTTLQRLNDVVFPFMKSTNSNVLVLDNATCQANKKVIDAINSHPTIRSVGFQSELLKAELRSEKGFPPSSPDLSWMDCGLFGPLEMKFRHSNPQTIKEAIKVATRLWDEISLEEIRKYISGYQYRLKEVIKAQGRDCHWSRSTYVEKTKN